MQDKPRTSDLREFPMKKLGKQPKKRLYKGVSQQHVVCEARWAKIKKNA